MLHPLQKQGYNLCCPPAYRVVVCFALRAQLPKGIKTIRALRKRAGLFLLASSHSMDEPIHNRFSFAVKFIERPKIKELPHQSACDLCARELPPPLSWSPSLPEGGLRLAVVQWTTDAVSGFICRDAHCASVFESR